MKQDKLPSDLIESEVFYQGETKKALENFQVTGRPFSKQLAKNIALIKMAAAFANHKSGVLDLEISQAIIKASREVHQGLHDDQLVVDEIQGGAGTSMHMNVNEIIASLAERQLEGKAVHPIDHVNRSQSTNDVIPTAMKITTLELLDVLISVYGDLHNSLEEKSKQFNTILKVGRTHLQDAVPITLGQEFSAHASAVKKDRQRLQQVKNELYDLNIGGTAVGTSLNAPEHYSDTVVNYLREYTPYPFQLADDLIYATQYADGFMHVSAILTVLATNLIKFMNDLRLLASGPRAGWGEIQFKPLQKGSSIMPGKVNPVMPETINQICFQVIGNNQAILMAVQAGQLELNVMLPVVAKNLFESLTILASGLRKFTELGLKPLAANAERCRSLFENSFAVATALTPHLGYDKVSALVSEAHETNRSLKDIVIERKILNEAEYSSIIKEVLP